MDPVYWKESFTSRWFAPDQEVSPEDAVQQVTALVQSITHDVASWARRLHAKHWHGGCAYPLLEGSSSSCIACRTIFDMEQLLLREVYVHIDGVVIDFFHEPAHKKQLDEAVKLYAWGIFHQGKHRQLIFQRDRLTEYAAHRIGRLHGESYVHKAVRGEDDETAQPGETTRADLDALTESFVAVYSNFASQFVAWRRAHPGMSTSAFPLEE